MNEVEKMKHINPRNNNRIALAPYNFVQLPEKIKTIDINNDFSRFRGYNGIITCEVETSSILFTRGMTSLDKFYQDEEYKDNPDFYTTNSKKPVLPGSSLRGLFRNLIEVISYSQLQSVSNNRLTYRSFDRTNHGENYRSIIMEDVPGQKNTFIPRVQCGYMRNVKGDWFIQPAQEIDGTTFARIRDNKIPRNLGMWQKCKNIQTIFIKPGPFKFQQVRGGFIKIKYAEVIDAKEKTEAGFYECALLRSGSMHQKLRETVVYPPDPQKASSKDWIQVEDELVTTYRNQISDEQKKILSHDGVLRNFHPVFYLMNGNKLVFFGHTMMMRLPYPKSPAEMVDKNLIDNAQIDLAKDMFGSIKNKDEISPGKLSFSDAECISEGEDFYEEVIQPHVMASPKPTTFQHYLTQNKPDDMKSLLDYNEKTTIRGTKFYWHKNAVGVADVKETKPEVLDKQKILTKIRPVRKGVKFRFTIRLENLSKPSLGALLFALELGKDPNYRLKMGMGKAYGMGALAISKCDLIIFSRSERYKCLFDEDSWYLGVGEEEYTERKKLDCLDSFEKFILSDVEINPGKLSQLQQLPRINQLLRLMSWPGPNPAYTRYLEIPSQNNRVNEYKERKVLPDPTDPMFD